MTAALNRAAASFVVAVALVTLSAGHHPAAAPKPHHQAAPLSTLSCRDNAELKLPASVADVEACVTGL